MRVHKFWKKCAKFKPGRPPPPFGKYATITRSILTPGLEQYSEGSRGRPDTLIISILLGSHFWGPKLAILDTFLNGYIGKIGVFGQKVQKMPFFRVLDPPPPSQKHENVQFFALFGVCQKCVIFVTHTLFAILQKKAKYFFSQKYFFPKDLKVVKKNYFFSKKQKMKMKNFVLHFHFFFHSNFQAHPKK